ncbi:bifunctional phosphopantothenoylcysteine decarboxylase/phosphopantothenate--cysteine ligase CoaBC [Candidatus Calescamantes bacterium]|nr:bifunctional phosphopantothenoylcysteine decarboxylase/phosphopantothenate--cysteine ligase CoaBC [Candidatus Calescamantes bacterium]
MDLNYPELENKRVIIGVTGSISLYKTCTLLRIIKKAGAEVRVVMTQNAMRFISPQTFQTISGNPVYTELFSSYFLEEPLHVRLAEWGEVILVAPATANIIGKIASGIADDLLSTLLMAFPGPIILSPAMNEVMWNNPTVEENIEKISEKGVEIVSCEKGELVSGKIGEGRMADVGRIIFRLRKVFSPQDLQGKKFLITAGPTREYLDDIRFLTNPSSGKMGYYLAEEVVLRGGEVLLISGPVSLPTPEDVRKIDIETTDDLRKNVERYFPTSDVLVMSAAVGDFKVKEKFQGKLKRKGKLHIELEATGDILKGISRKKEGKVVVGFSAEVEQLRERSKKKLEDKKVDLMVGCLIKDRVSGFGVDTIEGWLIWKDGREEKFSLVDKRMFAKMIIEKVKNIGGWK